MFAESTRLCLNFVIVREIMCVFSGRERDWQRLLPSEFEEMSPVPVAIFDSETDWSLLTVPISSRYSSF